MNRLYLYFVTAVLTISTVFGGVVWWQWPDHYTRVIFCDVGQGDAILITHGFFQLLVDAGPNSSVLECLDKNMPFWDRKIEWIALTHGHADHSAGLAFVLERYQYDLFLTNGSSYQTEALDEVYGLAMKQVAEGSRWVIAQAGQTGRVHDAFTVIVLAPEEKLMLPDLPSEVTEAILSDVTRGKWAAPQAQRMDENDLSIVLLVEIGEVRVLLTGDLESPGEQALMKKSLTQRVNILKVGHHGSKTSSTPKFVGEIEPELAVASVGKNNRYKHPAPEVIATLESVGARVWRTDEQGTLVIITDGQEYWQALP
jgi:competence protein ComEC